MTIFFSLYFIFFILNITMEYDRHVYIVFFSFFWVIKCSSIIGISGFATGSRAQKPKKTKAGEKRNKQG